MAARMNTETKGTENTLQNKGPTRHRIGIKIGRKYLKKCSD